MRVAAVSPKILRATPKIVWEWLPLATNFYFF
jgi:hypothetical protein